VVDFLTYYARPPSDSLIGRVKEPSVLYPGAGAVVVGGEGALSNHVMAQIAHAHPGSDYALVAMSKEQGSPVLHRLVDDEVRPLMVCSCLDEALECLQILSPDGAFITADSAGGSVATTLQAVSSLTFPVYLGATSRCLAEWLIQHKEQLTDIELEQLALVWHEVYVTGPPIVAAHEANQAPLETASEILPLCTKSRQRLNACATHLSPRALIPAVDRLVSDQGQTFARTVASGATSRKAGVAQLVQRIQSFITPESGQEAGAFHL